jgi:hypothetical protein
MGVRGTMIVGWAGMIDVIFFWEVSPVVDLDLVNRRGHSCGLVWAVVKRCVALRGVNMFVFAFLNDFNNLVMTGMF